MLTMTSFDVIADRTIDVYVSSVSAMEIATKFRIGKLPQATAYASRVADVAAEEGFELLPLSAAHADLAGSFVSLNNDPWDRLLAAQAKLENLALISNDSKMDDFGIAQFW